jgi:hypothetical protein
MPLHDALPHCAMADSTTTSNKTMGGPLSTLWKRVDGEGTEDHFQEQTNKQKALVPLLPFTDGIYEPKVTKNEALEGIDGLCTPA